MKAMAKSAGAIILGALLLCFLAVALSRHNAIRIADRLMLPALPAGWSRFEASPVLWVGGQFKPCWWIRYSDADRTVDLPEDVAVSFTGQILHTSLPKPAATRPSNQSLQLTAGRSDISHETMKTPPFQSTLAPADGS
jgi:hypothetical protein